VVFREHILPNIRELPENVREIWSFGFNEMLNNAIEHSSGTSVRIRLIREPGLTKLWLLDDGEGIFRKIQRVCSLLDQRHAVLELSKGKLTTDPAHHSGEGIFFTSRSFDEFEILSGEVYLSRKADTEGEWVLQSDEETPGTCIILSLSPRTERRMKDVFGHYTSEAGDSQAFSKTVVPVALALYGDEMLVSRSQARRLLARFDRFRTVVLDFTGITSIGQGFADEVFRVFPTEHPNIELVEVNTRPDVQAMIDRARSTVR
jgi:anti-sigma regulatory factor (Ser/Thr protein kinase)